MHCREELTKCPFRADLMHNRVGRVLIIKLSSLGDLLQLSPLMAYCRQLWPGAVLELVTGPAAAAAAVGLPGIDRVVVREPGLSGLMRTMRTLRRNRYDIAVDLQGLLRSWFLLSGVRSSLKIGKGRFPLLDICLPHDRSRVRHAVRDYFSWLEFAGFPVPSKIHPGWVLQPVSPQEDALLTEIAADGQPVAVLHPFTRWPSKCWTESRWRGLAEMISAAGISVVIAGAAGDRAAAARIAGDSCRNTAGAFSIAGFAKLLSLSCGAVTLDSFAMHLADQLGVPLAVLFGATDPRRTGPVSSGTVVVVGRGCRRIPCLQRRCRKKKHCLEAVTSGEVFAAFCRVAGLSE